MKQRTRRWGMAAVLLLLFMMWQPLHTVQAASVTIQFFVTEETVRVGEEFELTILLTSTDTMGDVEAYFSYDETKMEPTSKPACISGGGGLLKISDIGASASYGERTYRIRFFALEPGECEFSVYDRPKVYGYTDGIEMSVTGQSGSVSVFPAENASSNSTLSALLVADGASERLLLTPGFSPETTTYFTAVSYDTEQLIISAPAADSRSQVAISGETGLRLGNNEVRITVTAENGTKTEYLLYVFREAEPTAAPTAAPLPEPALSAGIVLELSEDAVLVTEYHRYTVVDRPAELTVPEGYAETYLFLNGIQIPAYERREGVGETLLLVLSEEGREAGWYRYDRIRQTVQRLMQEEITIRQEVVPDDTETELLQQYRERHATMLFVMAVLCGVCVVLILIILWLLLTHGRRRRKERWQGEA